MLFQQVQLKRGMSVAKFAVVLVVVGCGGETTADPCVTTYHTVCEKIFLCDPDGGTKVWQTEANCETVSNAQVGCSTNPPCQGRGTLNAANATACATNYTNATCYQVQENMLDVSPCSKLCE